MAHHGALTLTGDLSHEAQAVVREALDATLGREDADIAAFVQVSV